MANMTLTPVRALVQSSHPGPCLAITAITVALAVGAGAWHDPGPGPLAVFAASVLAGQLSIGWSNDALDAERDAAGGRTDKPLVAGSVSHRAVLVAAVTALVASFALGLWLGLATAAWLVPVVGAGWAYNLGLKATALSGLAYVAGFGPIPALAASILPGSPWPQAWALTAAALLGVGAHFANVLPDLAADRASGVRGLPQTVALRAGEPAVRLTALVLLLGASALIAFAPGASFRAPALAGLTATVALAVVALRGRGRTPFRCALGIAAIDVLMFTLGGGDLV
jgi:4-hydroxybenzoate polyprenyltransferase